MKESPPSKDGVDEPGLRKPGAVDPNEKISQLELEQYVLGELPENQKETVETWLQTDEGQARLQALQESNHTLLEHHPPGVAAADIKRRLRLDLDRQRTDSQRRKAVALTFAVGAAAVLLILWWQWPTETTDSQSDTRTTEQDHTGVAGNDADRPREEAEPGDGRVLNGGVAKATLPPEERPGDEVTREKGLEPKLRIYRKQGDAEKELNDGAIAQARDLLQVAYVAGGEPHGVIVSIDGRGVATLHFPTTPDGETMLERNGRTPLPNAYQLDDAPRFERFFFVTSDAPIDAQRILTAAKTVATGPEPTRTNLALPRGLDQTSFTLLKR